MSWLNINTSSGSNSIPAKIVHLVQDQISKHLATICNLPLSTGILLKMGKVIPIHKKDSEVEVSVNRPISLLSNIDKYFEKVTYNRLTEFLEERQVLYYKQFGFQNNFSRNHVILYLLEIVQKALDDGKIACGIFISLEKAFDTVSHDILLEKLDHNGIRGISNDWFRSYLSERSQFVSISDFNSDYKTIKYGVPQSSVLDELLACLNFHKCS